MQSPLNEDYLLSNTNSPHSKHCSHCATEPAIDTPRRRFLRTGAQLLGCIGAACALIPFVSSLNPSRRVLAANGPIDVDVSGLQPGQQMTVVWRGKPIWVIHRTPAMLAQLQQANPALRDPHSLVMQQPPYAQNDWRSLRPEYLVLVGVCTHLGCTPNYQPQDPNVADIAGGFYCPCHGSRFDLAGRVYQHMPAPINLEVPPYRFIGEHRLRIGETA
jgi:ubiquinol-cytochrome c reductase iron-sulfur subunit